MNEVYTTSSDLAEKALSFSDLEAIAELMPKRPTEEQKQFAILAGYPEWHSIKISPQLLTRIRRDAAMAMKKPLGPFDRLMGIPVVVEHSWAGEQWSTPQMLWHLYVKLMVSSAITFSPLSLHGSVAHLSPM
jgi:hypothetical protein